MYAEKTEQELSDIVANLTGWDTKKFIIEPLVVKEEASRYIYKSKSYSALYVLAEEVNVPVRLLSAMLMRYKGDVEAAIAACKRELTPKIATIFKNSSLREEELTYKGVTYKNLTHLYNSGKFAVPFREVRERIGEGWGLEAALNTPVSAEVTVVDLFPVTIKGVNCNSRGDVLRALPVKEALITHIAKTYGVPWVKAAKGVQYLWGLGFDIRMLEFELPHVVYRGKLIYSVQEFFKQCDVGYSSRDFRLGKNQITCMKKWVEIQKDSMLKNPTNYRMGRPDFVDSKQNWDLRYELNLYFQKN